MTLVKPMASQPNLPAGPRAKRFPLEIPLQVRIAGTDNWWNATTEDISANGVRFRTPNYMPPQTAVDVRFRLPKALAGDGAVNLECTGRVVRTSEGSLLSDEARVAVTFSDFHVASADPRSSEFRQEKYRMSMEEASKSIHRLNTLLFLVMGNAELLTSNQNLDPAAREMATRALNAVEEASQTVRLLAAALKKLS